MSHYLTIQEVAELARCEHKAVRRAISRGALRAFRPTKRLLIRDEDATAWIEESAVAHAPPRRSHLSSGAPAPARPKRAGTVGSLLEIEREAMGA